MKQDYLKPEVNIVKLPQNQTITTSGDSPIPSESGEVVVTTGNEKY